ncbi:primase-helicase family protein [Rhizobium sp. AAP43]|uniref:primase-helicase family protein n=1 Tax=Rhizobium sp. AAP43 TaxID=1523420 RepID=UPI0006B9125A|nr:primase-helicase family protein [Rhizobium sp. AAP43]KPF47268.1 hypothetical protein IP76_00405 [Rhizobium sp. AAP43]
MDEKEGRRPMTVGHHYFPLPDEQFVFNPNADGERNARAVEKGKALAEQYDHIVNEGPHLSVLGKAFVDDEGVPGHIFFTGGEADLLREWVFITSDNEFFNTRTGETVSRAAFDLSMAKVTPSVKITKDGRDAEHKKFPASKTLVEYLNGAVVFGKMYRPDIATPLFEYEGKQWVNAYLRAFVPMADADCNTNDAWFIVWEHIHNIVPDGAETIIKWMAHNVQHPGVKVNWVPVLIGVPGDGKTSIAEALAAAMGRTNVGNVSSDALFSGFSSWGTGKAVQALEEIRVTGQNRHAAMDKLKVFITNPFVPIHKKGQDEFNVVNVTNYLAFTNHVDALALTDDDRRWAIWKTRFNDRSEVRREMPTSYFERFYEAINNHPGVIRAWLLNHDISDFDRTSPPETTTWKKRMIEASRGSAEVEIREAISLGGFGIGEAVLATDCLNDAIARQCGHKISTSVLAATLERIGWTKIGAGENGRTQIKWRKAARTVYYRSEAFAAEPSPDFVRLHLPGPPEPDNFPGGVMD